MEFDYKRPFQTKGGRSARLLGIIASLSTPLVVAINGGYSFAETVVQYPKDGQVVDDILSLVNIDKDEHGLKATDFVHAIAVGDMAPMDMKVSNNPFQYDAFSMGTELVRGWIAMHSGYDRPEEPMPLQELTLVNTRSGQRIKINLMTKK